MLRLERPNGYFQTSDPISGRKIEGETRSCVHCGFMWVYNPMDSFDRKLAGKPVVRGKCLRCFGLVCARPECLKEGCVPLQVRLAEMEGHNKSLIIT